MLRHTISPRNIRALPYGWLPSPLIQQRPRGERSFTRGLCVFLTPVSWRTRLALKAPVLWALDFWKRCPTCPSRKTRIFAASESTATWTRVRQGGLHADVVGCGRPSVGRIERTAVQRQEIVLSTSLLVVRTSGNVWTVC